LEIEFTLRKPIVNRSTLGISLESQWGFAPARVQIPPPALKTILYNNISIRVKVLK
jgi:hypothetical protein